MDRVDGSIAWEIQVETDGAEVVCHVSDADHPRARQIAAMFAHAGPDLVMVLDALDAAETEIRRLTNLVEQYKARAMAEGVR